MDSEESIYISLQEAAKHYEYSQEYLSLRARQGKLKAVKFGRNWVTKKEWLKEYLEKVEEYNNNNKNHFQKLVSPPKNLPVEPSAPFSFKEFLQIYQPRFIFITVLIFVLLTTSFIFGKDSFTIVFETFNPYLTEFNENTNSFFADCGTSFSNVLEMAGAKEVMGKNLKDYFSWLGENLKPISQKIVMGYFTANDFLERKINQGFKTISQLFKKSEKIVKERLFPESTKEGLVVIPSTGKDEEVKEKIKESFSDEVRVEPEDKTSGIIIPVFKEGEGERYLYIMVPIQN